jgi:hypothetical protein
MSTDLLRFTRAFPGSAAPSTASFRSHLWPSAVLILGVALLAYSAPRNGEFWWSDAPRHALNGVFLADLLVDRPPLASVQTWAIEYYLQYPALTILFYPPLFAAVEAAVFLPLGASHAVAVAVVMSFYIGFALGAYALARRWLPREAAVAAALLAIALPEIALWGRQIMTEIPAYSFLVWSLYFFDRTLAERRTKFLYPALTLLVLAVYTKLTVIFIGVVYAVLVLWTWRGAAFRDRHVWVAALTTVIAIAPLAVLTAKFGQANVQSATGIPDAVVARGSLAGWLFYLTRLPLQIGYIPILLATAYVAAALARRGNVLPPRALALISLWIGIGYAFYSSIALKEDRHTIFLLLPFAILAIAGLVRAFPGWIGSLAAIGFATATLATTLYLHPVPRVEGYKEAAHWIVENTSAGRVMFSGRRDGSFIFNLRTLDRHRKFTVLRADKLLLSISVRRELGVAEKDVSREEIRQMFHDLGIRYVVAERDFWIDLRTMRDLQTVFDGNSFEELKRIEVRANVYHADRELRIYRYRGEIADPPAPLRADLPVISRTFGTGRE